MNDMSKGFRLTAIAAGLAGAFGAAQADEAEIRALTEPSSSISVGVGNWSKDRRQLGLFDGMRDSGTYGLIDADVVKRDEATGTWTTLRLRNLGLDTRELRGEWLRQGNIGGYLEYSRIPRDNPLIFNTGLRGIGSTSLLVSNTGANALPRSVVDIGTRRDLVRAGFYKNLMPGLELKIDFKNEDKDGTRQWGRGGQPEFAVEPINATTRQMDVALSYANKALQVSGGYQGTWYDNAHGLVSTLRAGEADNLTNRIYLSLPLDNEAHKLFVNAGYNLSSTTRLTFKAARTRLTQNEHLPTRDIAGLSLAGSPGSLDGRVDTTLVQLGMTARPLPQLSVVANLRYHNNDDKTPTAQFVNAGGVTTSNTPYTFKTKSGKIEATYRLPEGFSLVGGYDVRNQDRSLPVGRVVGGVDQERFVPHRTKLDEDTLRLQLRRSLSDTVNGSISFLHSKRKGSGYTLTESDLFDLINPINIADRKRDKWRLSADWTPMPKLAFQFNYEDSKDEYGHGGDRPYGLRDGRASSVSIDATYSLGDKLQLSAWLSHDENKANQLNGRWTRGTEQFEAEHLARLKDTGDSIGIGVRSKLSSAVKLGADLQWTNNDSRYQDDVVLTGNFGPNGYGTRYPTSAGVTAVPLPDIHNRLRRLTFFAEYAMRKNADLRVDLSHERWRSDDWSWLFADGSPFRYGGATIDQTTVTPANNASSTFVGVRYLYKFQ